VVVGVLHDGVTVGAILTLMMTARPLCAWAVVKTSLVLVWLVHWMRVGVVQFDDQKAHGMIADVRKKKKKKMMKMKVMV